MKTDRHLNLFCSYGNHWLEDNVTRALMVTLRTLPATYQRLFLRDVLMQSSDLQHTIEVTDPSELEFDLQVYAANEDPDEGEPEDKLTKDTGILVGLRSGDDAPVEHETWEASSRAARMDAVITDSSGVTAVIEVKLGPHMNEEQMHRHRDRFFNHDVEMSDVRSDVRWTTVIEFLDRLALQLRGRHDAFILDEFISYVDMLGLSPFAGFRRRARFTNYEAKLSRSIELLDSLDGRVEHVHQRCRIGCCIRLSVHNLDHPVE